MDAKAFMQAVVDAQAMVSEVEELYRVAAFQVALSLSLGLPTSKSGIEPLWHLARQRTPMSFEEFAARLPKSLTSHKDRFVAVGYYLIRYSESPVFRASEVVDVYYARVHWARPKNASDLANHCAKKGYYQLDRTDEKGAKLWSITQLGIEYMEELLRGDSEA